MIKIKIPQSTSNDDEVFIAEWKFSKSDSINKGQHIVSIETSKVVEEIYAEESGYLDILLEKNARVKPGQTIGLIVKKKEELQKENSIKKELKFELNFTKKAKDFIEKNKIKLSSSQLKILKENAIVKESDITNIIKENSISNPKLNNQLIILIKEKNPYHAAVYLEGYGIIDLSLLGSRITPIEQYNFSDCNCLFYKLNSFNTMSSINFYKDACLLTDKIITKEKSERGWFKKTESADYILKFRKIRSKNIDDMNCIEWLVHGLEKGGIKIPDHVLTANELNKWCMKNFKAIEEKDNKVFISLYK
ncbi:MAG: Pyruvate/2-oxoglutarate dehydrogenase complex, dihydrolipoamide acyltransferase (E2) component [Pelagibacterales bacterium]|nr:Pyruvate/2-oxoglutarate dehydrogenase complex, dihydrolipoamide acyltransferase (E2) component [Pelagibacterales bacterium]